MAENTTEVQIIRYSDGWQNRTRGFILEVLENEFGIRAIRRPDLDDIGAAYQSKKGGFWLAIAADQVVGTIGMMDAGKKRGYLKRWYVGKNRRGQGIGTALMDTLLQHARQAGLKKIYIATGPALKAAIAHYERKGFKRIAQLPDDMPVFNDTVFFEWTI